MPTPSGDNETARLMTLHDQAILDTPPEPTFDEPTYLAAQICGTPVALLGFLDRDRLWFKARVGYDGGQAAAGFGVLCDPSRPGGVVVISDTRFDPRAAGNPAIEEPLRARFWAAAPLMTIDGHLMGALAVADHVPRTIEEWQTDALRRLAGMVIRELDARRSRRVDERRRLGAMGSLAGGVAHEINNVLAVLMGTERSPGGPPEAGDPRSGETRRILECAGRAASLTRQMLVLSRHRSMVPTTLDLNEIIGRHEKGWRAAAGGRVRLELELAPHLGAVKADRSRIETALGHLVDCALSGLSQAGLLKVTTGDRDRLGVRGARADNPPGGYVAIEVTGTPRPTEGPDGAPGHDGLPIVHEIDAVLARMLPAVLGIATECGGDFIIEPSPGGGTTFRLLLPRLAETDP